MHSKQNYYAPGVGGAPYPEPSTLAPDKSIVEENLDRLDMNIEMMEGKLAMLIQRLLPVLREQPLDNGPKEKSLVAPSSCMVGNRLASATIRIQQTTDRIDQQIQFLCI